MVSALEPILKLTHYEPISNVAFYGHCLRCPYAKARAAMEAAVLEAQHVAEDQDVLDSRRAAILNELSARENAAAKREAEAGERVGD